MDGRQHTFVVYDCLHSPSQAFVRDVTDFVSESDRFRQFFLQILNPTVIKSDLVLLFSLYGLIN